MQRIKAILELYPSLKPLAEYDLNDAKKYNTTVVVS